MRRERQSNPGSWRPCQAHVVGPKLPIVTEGGWLRFQAGKFSSVEVSVLRRGDDESAARIEGQADQAGTGNDEFRLGIGTHAIDAARLQRSASATYRSPRASTASPCGRPNPSCTTSRCAHGDRCDTPHRATPASAPWRRAIRPSTPYARWNAATLGGSDAKAVVPPDGPIRKMVPERSPTYMAPSRIEGDAAGHAEVAGDDLRGAGRIDAGYCPSKRLDT